MIEGSSPDWLPTGWTEQVKVTNGRKVKCYIDPLTGRKFYSKPQVSDYLITVKHDSSASQTKKMGIASSNMGELTGGKTTLKPEGSQFRTRSSSKKMEVVFSNQPVEKLNMGELTGGRTSLKEEESHNVKTPKRTRCKSEKKQTGSSMEPVLNMGEYTGGNTSPKEQESQNVKTPKQAAWKSKQKQTGSSTQLVEKVVIERVKPDGLPPGWLKEIKIQKTANGSRKDPYYTDPVSGYVFFSRKDALRYLETGDFNSCSMKPKKRLELGFLKEETLPKMGQLTGGKTSLKEQESQNVKTPKRTSCTSERMQTGSSMLPVEEVVVERVTPDGLPTGWLKEIKIQKKANGTRKDPYYTDPVSGYVFFSRKDALRYLETGDFNSCSMKPKKRNELGFLKDETSPNMGGLTGAKHYPKPEGSPNVKTPKRTSRRTSKCKETDSTMQPLGKAVIETVAHDGLPPGWLKETYYTDPVSGYVFFSQKDALHYLETGDVDRCSIKPKKRDELGFLNEETSPNKSELTGVKTSLKQEGSQNATTPKSTSRVAKRKQRGGSEQSVQKSNVGKLTGGKTSLKQVGSRSARTPKRTSRVSKQKQMGKVGIERVTPDGLPPGWIKEIRFQTKANGTRKDMYYTDPVSGYVFWSQKDALRYLEVGDFSQCSIKPKKRDELEFLNQESSASLPSAATTQTLEHYTPKRRPFTGKQNNGTSSLETTDAGGPRKRQRILKGKKSADNVIEECAATKESCDPSSSALPIPKGSKRKRGKRVGTENGTVTTPSAENKSNRKTRIDSSKSKKKKALSLPSRSSKRLVALKSGETEVEPLVRALDKVTDSGHRQFQTVSDSGITDNAFRDTEAPLNVKLLNTSKNPLEDQPVPQDQPVREEAGKKDEQNQDHENPFGDTWSDPCLEFAFKTLSGEMPVEDNLPTQDNVQQQPDNPNPQTAGCLSLLDFGVPTFFQNNIVSEFDAPGKPVSSSQPTSPFLASGNVSSLFFDTPAKLVSDSIPQLPTSPKFQASGNVSSPSCDALGQLPTSPRFGAVFDSPGKPVSPSVPQLRYSPVFQASGNVSSPVLDAPGKPVSDSAPQLPTNPSLLPCGNAPQQPNLDENKEHQRNLNL